MKYIILLVILVVALGGDDEAKTDAVEATEVATVAVEATKATPVVENGYISVNPTINGKPVTYNTNDIYSPSGVGYATNDSGVLMAVSWAPDLEDVRVQMRQSKEQWSLELGEEKLEDDARTVRLEEGNAEFKEANKKTRAYIAERESMTPAEHEAERAERASRDTYRSRCFHPYDGANLALERVVKSNILLSDYDHVKTVWSGIFSNGSTHVELLYKAVNIYGVNVAGVLTATQSISDCGLSDIQYQ